MGCTVAIRVNIEEIVCICVSVSVAIGYRIRTSSSSGSSGGGVRCGPRVEQSDEIHVIRLACR